LNSEGTEEFSDELFSQPMNNLIDKTETINQLLIREKEIKINNKNDDSEKYSFSISSSIICILTPSVKDG
jgi:hypothetical protein